MRKKISALIMTVMIFAACLPAVYASNEISLVVTADKTAVAPGGELVLIVTLQNAVDVAKMQFRFNYDTAQLEYKSCTYGAAVSGASTKKAVKGDGYAGFVAALNAKPFSGTAAVCSFTFTVKDNATAGAVSYEIINTKFGTAEGTSESIAYDAASSDMVQIRTDSFGEVSVSGGLLTVNFTVNDAAESAVVIIGYYADNGVLADVRILDIAGFSGQQMINIKLPEEEIKRIKLFMLKGAATPFPLAPAKEIGI